MFCFPKTFLANSYYTLLPHTQLIHHFMSSHQYSLMCKNYFVLPASQNVYIISGLFCTRLFHSLFCGKEKFICNAVFCVLLLLSSLVLPHISKSYNATLLCAHTHPYTTSWYIIFYS